MKNFKRILNYLFWTVISLLVGILHMRIVLGPQPKPSTGILKMFDWAYGVALIQVGLIIGGIIAFVYILLDLFYIRRKLLHKKNLVVIRFLIIIAIAIVVGILHYLLEEVIDVI